MRRDEGDLPPDSITVFEKLVHDMRSQESGDASNLGIGRRLAKTRSRNGSGYTHENKWLGHLELDCSS